MAIQQSDSKTAVALIEKGADVNEMDNVWTFSKPLPLATKMNQVDVMEALVAHGAAMDTTNDPPLLHVAAGNNSVSAVKWLLAKKVPVDTRDRLGRTALHEATSKKCAAAAEELVANKADLNAKANDGTTPLIAAIQKEDPAMIKALLDLGADPNAARSNVPPLMIFVNKRWGGPFFSDKEDTKIAALLIDKGAKVNAGDKSGDTPLMWAVQAGHSDFARKLLSLGADEKIANKSGTIALHHAALRGDLELVELFLGRGSSASAVKSNGWTVLHSAVQAWTLQDYQEGNLRGRRRVAATNAPRIIKLLVERGAAVNARDKEGRTPMDVAIEEFKANTNAVTQALFEGGAMPNSIDGETGDNALNKALFARHFEGKGDKARALELYESALPDLEKEGSSAAGKSRKAFWQAALASDAGEGGTPNVGSVIVGSIVAPKSSFHYRGEHHRAKADATLFKRCAEECRKGIGRLKNGPRYRTRRVGGFSFGKARSNRRLALAGRHLRSTLEIAKECECPASLQNSGPATPSRSS